MNNSHSKHLASLVFIIVGLTAFSVKAQNASFTYQGELTENGQPASGPHDMQFSLFDSANGGNQHGVTLTINQIQVVEGRFSVELDFGANVFDNSERWLEITVNGFTLTPRNPITRSPYAVQTRGIYVDNQNRVAMGTLDPEPDARLTLFNFFKAIHAVSESTFSPTIYGRNDFGPVIWADGVSDVQPGQGGVVIIGQEGDYNLAIDRNEIMARMDGNASTLHLNLEGGDIVTGGRMGVGVDPGFAQMRINDTDPTAAFGLEVRTQNQDSLPSIFAANDAGGPVIWAQGNNDSSLDGGGLIVVGEESTFNISIDRNEIMARNNGQPSTLHLNLEGGEVLMGEHAIRPAYAYGRIDYEGNVLSASSNVTGVTLHPQGRFRIGIAGGLNSSDIAVVSGWRGLVTAGSEINEFGQLEVSVWSNLLDEWTHETFDFVIYRP